MMINWSCKYVSVSVSLSACQRTTSVSTTAATTTHTAYCLHYFIMTSWRVLSPIFGYYLMRRAFHCRCYRCCSIPATSGWLLPFYQRSRPCSNYLQRPPTASSASTSCSCSRRLFSRWRQWWPLAWGLWASCVTNYLLCRPICCSDCLIVARSRSAEGH